MRLRFTFVAILLSLTLAAHADPFLDGTTLSATLTFGGVTNYFTNPPGAAPATFLFGPGIPSNAANFSYDEFTGGGDIRYGAQLTDSGTLFIGLSCPSRISGCGSGISSPFTMTFSDPALTSAPIVVESTFGTETFYFYGDTFTFSVSQFLNPVFSYQAQFQFAPSPTTPTPEPGSIVLLGTGILALGGLLRKRLADGAGQRV